MQQSKQHPIKLPVTENQIDPNDVLFQGTVLPLKTSFRIGYDLQALSSQTEAQNSHRLDWYKLTMEDKQHNKTGLFLTHRILGGLDNHTEGSLVQIL